MAKLFEFCSFFHPVKLKRLVGAIIILQSRAATLLRFVRFNFISTLDEIRLFNYGIWQFHLIQHAFNPINYQLLFFFVSKLNGQNNSVQVRFY